MNEIKRILGKESPSFDELINCFELVKEHGNVAVIKFDGERNENYYTVFISFPHDKINSMIRADGSNLRDLLKRVLLDYIEEFNSK